MKLYLEKAWTVWRALVASKAGALLEEVELLSTLEEG
jgi:hypothetical protein